MLQVSKLEVFTTFRLSARLLIGETLNSGYNIDMLLVGILILLCHINGLRKNSYIALSGSCFCAFEMSERSACLEFPPERLRDDDIYSVIPEVVFGDPKSSPGYRQNGFSSNRLRGFREVIQQKRLDSRPKDYGMTKWCSLRE